MLAFLSSSRVLTHHDQVFIKFLVSNFHEVLARFYEVSSNFKHVLMMFHPSFEQVLTKWVDQERMLAMLTQ